MSLTTHLAFAVVRYVAGGACRAAGLQDAGEKAVDALIERFKDHSQRLPRALAAATDRAWKTLELTLAGDSLWRRLTSWGDDTALAGELRQALVVVKYDESVGDKARFFAACLTDLRAARRAGLLSGVPTGDELQRHRRAMTNYADPAALVKAEWDDADRMAGECLRAGYGSLATFLRLRTGELPFLTVAVRYYFRRAVTDDPELTREWTFAKLEAVGAAQERQFEALAGTLERHAARLEEMLADVQAAVQETHAGVRRIEDEMVRASDVEQLLAKFKDEIVRDVARNMGGRREVRQTDAMSIRDSEHKRKLKEQARQYRELPEGQRLQDPDLLEAVGRWEFAAGDPEWAYAHFALLASGRGDRRDHVNAYQAALGARNWDAALRHLLAAAKLAPESMPFDADKYIPERILGAGGFGVTFRCKHRRFGTPVAVKALIAEDLDRDPDTLFEEGRVLQEIDHAAIVRMLDGEFADPHAKARPFLVMEFIDGETLEARVEATGTLPLEDALTLAKQMASGLRAAHGRNVYHRDIKPANVMVRQGPDGWRAKVIDFGLALKRATIEAVAGLGSSEGRKSLIGSAIAGTLDYAAPEQMGRWPGVPVGAYSDVYGWAKTVCFALFKTPSPVSRHYKTKSVPDSLRELLEACLDEDPQHRPQSFADVLTRLARVEEELNPVLEIADRQPTKPAAVQWYYARSGQRHGPVAEGELKSLLAAGKVGPDDVVWRAGMPVWVPARTVEGLVPKSAPAVAKVRLCCEPEEIVSGSGLFGRYDNMKELVEDVLKVYVDGKFMTETNRLHGFDLKFEAAVGSHLVEVAWWEDKQETDRKKFNVNIAKTGEYVLRFNFVHGVKDSVFGATRHMKNSTVEVLKEPG